MRKKKKIENANFIALNYKKCWDFLRESKGYVLFSGVLILLFFIIGFAFPVFFEKEIFNFMSAMSAKIEGYGVLQLVWFIIANNAKSAFLAIIFGILLGIIPLANTVVNGYLIGFVARHSVESEGILILWKLFPHGIFELPAIIISIGFGLKIGLGVFKGEIKKNIKESIRFFIFVILPLLIIAGFIEGILIFLLK